MQNIPSLERFKKSNQTLTAGAEPGTFTETIYNGRTVTWRLVQIPPSRLKQATLIWSGNERCQEFLTDRALEDITSSLGDNGNSEWGKGRLVNGLHEVADGSRRLMACILKEKPYNLLVGDLTDAEMDWFSDVGNRYNPPSAWEKGQRYARLEKQLGSLRALESYLQDRGEPVSRRTIARCLTTSQLPKEVMMLFTQPGYLTPVMGSNLYGKWAGLPPEQRDALLLEAIDFHPNPEDQRDHNDEMYEFLMTWQPPGEEEEQEPQEQTDQPQVKTFRHGKISHKGGGVSLTVGKSLDPQTRQWLLGKLEELMQTLDMPGWLARADVSQELWQEMQQKVQEVAAEQAQDCPQAAQALKCRPAGLAQAIEQLIWQRAEAFHQDAPADGPGALKVLMNIRVLRASTREWLEQEGVRYG